MTRDYKMKVASDEKRLVYAEVYAPDIPDSNGDYMTAEEIEKMAHGFMRNMRLRELDTEHDGVSVQDCCVIESFIARKGDPTFIEGAWVAGVHVLNDEMWKKIKSGEINGFSMEAMVRTKKMMIEIDVPPVVHGFTTTAEDGHSHEFFVSYNDRGEFIGGRTAAAPDGHFHLIRLGTVTEEAKDHTHRFNGIDGVKIVAEEELPDA